MGKESDQWRIQGNRRIPPLSKKKSERSKKSKGDRFIRFPGHWKKFCSKNKRGPFWFFRSPSLMRKCTSGTQFRRGWKVSTRDGALWSKTFHIWRIHFWSFLCGIQDIDNIQFGHKAVWENTNKGGQQPRVSSWTQLSLHCAPRRHGLSVGWTKYGNGNFFTPIKLSFKKDIFSRTYFHKFGPLIWTLCNGSDWALAFQPRCFSTPLH